MKRIRLVAVLAALLPGVFAGCSNFGQGPIMSRFHRSQPECACETPGGPCCDGPMLGDGMVAGPAEVAPPAGPPVVPAVPIGPAPRILQDPAAPFPASPSSRIK